MPNPEITSNATPLGSLIHDVWGIIISRLPLRQQVQFRTLSRGLRHVVDTNQWTTYAQLLSRSAPLSECVDPSYPAPVRFFNTWAANFRLKLKGDELDFFCGVVTGKRALVNDLLKQNPRLVTLCDVQGNTAFHYAAACGQPEIFFDLYQAAERAGRLKNKRVSVITRKTIDEYETTPLYLRKNAEGENSYDLIIRYGQLEKFKVIFKLKSGSANLISFQKSAARYGKIELLFDQGLLSDPETMTQANQRPEILLHIAARYGQRKLLARFLQDPRYDNAFLRRLDDPRIGANVFHLAVQSGNEALVDDLLKRDAHLIASRDAVNRPALFYAVASGQLSMVEKIYAMQPDEINANFVFAGLASEGSCLPRCAVEQGNLEILKYLFEKGARISSSQLSGLPTAVSKFAALKKRGADAKQLQTYQDIVVYFVNYFAAAVKDKKYTVEELQSGYDDAIKDAVEGEADELLPILTAAGAKPTDLNTFNNTNEQDKLALPKARRDLIEEYQQQHKKSTFSRYGKLFLQCIGLLAIYASLLLPLAASFLAGVALSTLPLYLALPVAAKIAVIVAIGTLAILLTLAIVKYIGLPYIDYFFNQSFFPTSVQYENRQLSPVNNVVPLYNPLLAKQYYLEPLKVSIKPGVAVDETAALSTINMNKNKEAVVESAATDKGKLDAVPEKPQIERIDNHKIDSETEIPSPPCLKA